jgi:hypothetical protein
MAVRSKTITGIADSNPDEDTDVCFLCVFFVGLCDELIACTEEFYKVYVCVCVCV